MAMEELETFMAAIRKLESGSLQGDYGAIGVPTSDGSRARGAYQIMDKYWDAWAAEAGIRGAQWRDPLAQDRVARYKFTQYYQTYGDWRLVAIAWFAGPGRANAVAKAGLSSVAGIADANGTTIGKYVQVIANNMKEAAQAGYGPTPSPDVLARLDPQAQRMVSLEQQGRMQYLDALADPNNPAEYPRPNADVMDPWNPDLSKLQALAGDELVEGQTPGYSMGPRDALASMFQVLANHRRKFSGTESLGEATV